MLGAVALGMQRPAIYLMFALCCCDALAARRVTVEQLDRWFAANHGKADAKLASGLNELELTERLSTARVGSLEAMLPGPESRRALVALADQAVFLDPPPAENAPGAPPSAEGQRQILSRAVGYVHSAIERLPNFYATRDTIRFADSPAFQDVTGTFNVSGTFIPYKPLHPISRSKGTVLYSDGKESIESHGAAATEANSKAGGLTTSGEFGPILLTVLGDVREDSLSWHHWERGASGPRAVFHYAVAGAKSHYHVQFCCVAHAVFRKASGYHGEISIDPKDGTILRLTVMADMATTDPVARADIMVEYGQIELGERTYWCPTRSVSIFRAPMEAPEVHTPARVAGMMNGPPVGDEARMPLQTLLNEVVFEQYHLFRADVRIVDADNSGQPAATAASESAKEGMPPTRAIETGVAAESKTDASEPGASGTPAETSTGSAAGKVVDASADRAAAPVASESAGSSGPSEGAAVPPAMIAAAAPAEISVMGEPDLPDRSTAPKAGVSDATLRVSTRLVNVGLTAHDKKGNPLLDLKPEEVEVFDNGRKQRLSFFNKLIAPGSSQRDAAGQGTEAATVEFANRLAPGDGESGGRKHSDEKATILLVDANGLDFADLTHAREQMLKFLAGLAPSQCVGLYVRTASEGFRILNEPTCDHTAVASALRAWMPSAADLASAREVEQRNRQQMEDVHSATDLESVNGNLPGSGTVTTPRGGGQMQAPPSMTSDPKLATEGRGPGREPGRDALSSMVLVAMHLAAIPGHKSLVWIASDNVLANWSDQSAGTDKSGSVPNRDALQAQEFLNDAQVTIYPLDVSQLEAVAADASLQNSNVQLEEPVKEMTPVASLGDAARSARPGRITAEMRQNLRAIQPEIQQTAEATGGRVYRRSGSMAANLNDVIAEGEAQYLLGFSPDAPPDDQYHRITVKVTRRGVVLRSRAGYVYSREPVTLKDRFRQAVWQPYDASAIGIRAHVSEASNGKAIALNITTNDLSMVHEGDRWTDKLDIFLVQRDSVRFSGKVKGQTLVLRTEEATHEKLLREGVPFNEFVDASQASGTIRVIVIDENSEAHGVDYAAWRRSLAFRARILERDFNRQPVGQTLGVNFSVCGLGAERRASEHDGDFDFALHAVGGEELCQALVGAIHVVFGKGAFGARDIDRTHDHLVHDRRVFLYAGRVESNDEGGAMFEGVGVRGEFDGGQCDAGRIRLRRLGVECDAVGRSLPFGLRGNAGRLGALISATC
jgi:VWFA-related protein